MNMAANPRLWSVQCVLEWLQIREKEGHPFPQSLREFEMELDHSALFRRLIEGKQPLPNPPPLSFNYPWYELEEHDEVRPLEVDVLGETAVIVNQHMWEVEKKETETDMVIRHDSGTVCRLWLASIGSDEHGNSIKNWKIKKL